jgi:O-antigen/teichoic acid export membrane protein
LIIYPILVGLMLTAPEFVQVAYGSTWAPIVGPTRVFCLFGMIRVLINPSYALCGGVGKPHLPFKWSLIALPFNAALLWWGARVGGLMGVALAKLFLPVFTLFTLVVEITRIVGIPIRQIGLTAFPATCCAAVMAVAVLAVRYVPGIRALPSLSLLLLEVAVGLVAYLGALRLFYSKDFKGIVGLLKRIRLRD